MKLKSISVASYRSCIRTRLTLHPELTVLIGVNSAGKSNILSSLLLLKKITRSRSMRNREHDPALSRCQVMADIAFRNKSLFVKGDIVYESDERNADDVQYTNLKWNFREFINNAKWQTIPIEFIMYDQPYRFIVDRRWGVQRLREYREVLPKELSPVLHNAVRYLNSINYYSASQFADPSRCPVSIELEENRPMRRVRNVTVNHEKYILDLYNAYKNKSSHFKRYINTVNKDGIGLVDDIKFTEFEMPSSSYEVKSRGKIKKIERNRLLIIPSFIIDGNTLSPNQLSEGTFKTLALIFYVLTDDSKILLIEEPEVCVHHGLLSSIISLIKTESKRKQIIISTHSDFVLDHMNPENLILVSRKPETGTVAKQLTKYMSNNDYKALRQYLEESGNLGEYWREGGFENE